jgi:hypothetical protein
MDMDMDIAANNRAAATRAPQNQVEAERMFVEGIYTGHFRKTKENDCDLHPTTCTGHLVDFPCTWVNYIIPQTHYLKIALESHGNLTNGKYSPSQVHEIWAAANATKSNVAAVWFTPDILYQKYVNTDAAFQSIILPPPSQDCNDARISAQDRCSEHYQDQIGDILGACDEPPQPLQKVIATSLYQSTYDPQIGEAKKSPAYEAIQAFTLTSLQVGKLFDNWLQVGKDKDQKWNHDPREATCQWVVDNLDLVQTFIPRTYPRVLQAKKRHMAGFLFFVAFGFGILATTLVVLCIIFVYRQRERRVMKQAQVEFLLLLLSGLFLVAIASIILSIPPYSDASCVASIWLFNVGNTLELVPLIVKVAAIYRLVTAAQRMRRIVLKRQYLFTVVFLLASVVVLICILWTTLDPPGIETELLLTDNVTEEGETIVTSQYFCSSKSDLWRHICLTWYCILLLSASVFTFQTRKLRHDVNESQTLAILIYSHFFFVLLRLLTTFLEKSSLERADADLYRSLIFSCDTISVVVIYFVPKFFFVPDRDNNNNNNNNIARFLTTRRNPDGNQRQTNNTSSSSAGGPLEFSSSTSSERTKTNPITGEEYIEQETAQRDSLVVCSEERLETVFEEDSERDMDASSSNKYTAGEDLSAIMTLDIEQENGFVVVVAAVAAAGEDYSSTDHHDDEFCLGLPPNNDENVWYCKDCRRLA